MMPILFSLFSLVAFEPEIADSGYEPKPLPQLCKTWALDEKACAERIAKAGFSCQRIGEHHLYGLEPGYPAVACEHVGWGEPDEFVDASGCKFLVKHQYIFMINKDGKEELVLVKNKEDLASLFAPIESPEEAIGLVNTLTNAYATNVMPSFQTGTWKVAGVRPTTVVAKGEEYVVRMFLQGHCGCYTPFLDEVTFSVKRNGTYSTVSTVRIWEDDPGNEICVD